MHQNANVSQLQQRLTQQRMNVSQAGPMQMQPRPGMVRVRLKNYTLTRKPSFKITQLKMFSNIYLGVDFENRLVSLFPIAVSGE